MDSSSFWRRESPQPAQIAPNLNSATVANEMHSRHPRSSLLYNNRRSSCRKKNEKTSVSIRTESIRRGSGELKRGIHQLIHRPAIRRPDRRDSRTTGLAADAPILGWIGHARRQNPAAQRQPVKANRQEAFLARPIPRRRS